MHPIDELKRLVAARAKATEGPWIWDEPTNWLGLHIRLCNAEYQPIAQVQVSGWKPRSTGKHNANFLSMAGSIDLPAILAAWERDREAAKAYRDLATCYRVGKHPSEELFERLQSADAALSARAAESE